MAQHVTPLHRRPVPPEVLSPWSLTLLDQLGILLPAEAANCCGVLSRWGANEPDFYDYVLATTRPGLAVDRTSFHRELENAALAAGVAQVEDRVSGIHYRASLPCGGAYRLHADGRNTPATRRFEDRLIAMFMPCGADASYDRLTIEAVEDGWWYLPPQVRAVRFAVKVTDHETIPRGTEARAEWLRESLGRTNLIAAAAGDVQSKHAAGMDAKVAMADAVVWTDGARLGDAALALDPLSGNGIARALEGAAVAASDILEKGRAAEGYTAWVEDTHAEEASVRADIYRRAADRFDGAPFWRRRADRTSEQFLSRVSTPP